MLEGTISVVASSVVTGASDWGGTVFEEGGGVSTALVCWTEVDGVGVALDVSDTLVSDTGMEGSLLTGVGSLEIAVPVEIGEVTAVGTEVATPVSVEITEESLVSVGAAEVLTSVPVGRGVEVSTPVPLTVPEGVMPDVIETSVGADVETSVGADVGAVSDVGIKTDESVVAEGSEVVTPVPVGRTEGRLVMGVVPVGSSVGRSVLRVGSSVRMLEMALERSGRPEVSLGVDVGALVGSDVGIPVAEGAVGPSVESLIPDAVGVGVASVAVG